MKERIFVAILGLAMVFTLTACQKDSEQQEVTTVNYDAASVSPEQLSMLMSDLMQEEANAKYRNKDYQSFGLQEFASTHYIMASVPLEFVDQEAQCEISTGRVIVPLKIDGYSLSLRISASKCDYESGQTPKNIIDSYYDTCITNRNYKCLISPGENASSFKIVYDKKGTESYSSSQRNAVKTLQCGSSLVTITLSTEMCGSNKDIILDKKKAIEILDALNFESDLTEEEANALNEKYYE